MKMSFLVKIILALIVLFQIYIVLEYVEENYKIEQQIQTEINKTGGIQWNQTN